MKLMRAPHYAASIGTAIAASLMVVGLVSASTTISTNINTGGTLTVTDATTLSGTLGVTGATTLSSTLGVTGLTTLVYASTTAVSLSGNLMINGMATTTSNGNISTQGTLTVGSAGSAVTSMVFGTCTFGTVNITASSTGMVSCASATGIASGDKVFVTATSSLPNGFIIVHASTTAANVIQVDIQNLGYGGVVATGVNTLYFWGAR